MTASTEHRDRPRVIYVMGAGRSGSTILGVTLGNYDGVFYAGELDAWLTRAGEPLIEGERQHRFWRAVREGVHGAEALFGREPQLAIERSVAPFRVNKWRARRQLRGPYRRVAGELYRAVSRVSGAPVVVDSSHYPLRARELQALDCIELCLIFLRRDPRSVVASFNNREVAQYNKSTLTTNVYLWLTNLLCTLVFLRHPAQRRLSVRYEDFVADPGAVAGEILRCAHAEVSPPDFASLDTGVPFVGNRIIRRPQIALEVGAPQRVTRSPFTTLMQLPWALVLSRLRPAATPSSPISKRRARALAQ
jgi:Sulfotransferase family